MVSLRNPFCLQVGHPERAENVPRSHSSSVPELETQSASRLPSTAQDPGVAIGGGKWVWASHWSRHQGGLVQGHGSDTWFPCRGLRCLGLQAVEPGARAAPTAKTTSPSRDPKSPEAPESAQSEEEVDELSLIDHNEIMARLTLKQEVSSLRALPSAASGP